MSRLKSILQAMVPSLKKAYGTLVPIIILVGSTGLFVIILLFNMAMMLLLGTLVGNVVYYLTGLGG